MLKAKRVSHDFKPQSQVALQHLGHHTEETVKRNLGLKGKGARFGEDRLDLKDKVVG